MSSKSFVPNVEHYGFQEIFPLTVSGGKQTLYNVLRMSELVCSIYLLTTAKMSYFLYKIVSMIRQHKNIRLVTSNSYHQR